MRRALGCLVVVAGCGGPTGISIEVAAPSKTQAVELFVGATQLVPEETKTCADGSAASCMVVPPDTTTMTRGQLWRGYGYLDPSLRATRAEINEGAFEFIIEPDAGGDGYIPVVLVVAFDGNEQPIASAVLHDLFVTSKPHRYQVELKPAEPIPSQTDGVDHVQVWRRPGDAKREQSACALIQMADGTVKWFVPADDTDCDGALPVGQSPSISGVECRNGDFVYCGTFPGDLQQARCATQHAGSCRIAAPMCIDGGDDCVTLGTSSDCSPTTPPACLEPEVCARAVVNGCDLLVEASSSDKCIPDALIYASFGNAGAFTGVPYLRCLFALDPAMQPCTGVWPTIDPIPLPQLTQNQPCQAIELAALGSPFVHGPQINVLPTVMAQLVPNGNTCGGTIQLSFSGPSTESEGNGLFGFQTTDDARRYVMLTVNFAVYGSACTQDSACVWTNVPTNYDFPCN